MLRRGRQRSALVAAIGSISVTIVVGLGVAVTLHRIHVDGLRRDDAADAWEGADPQVPLRLLRLVGFFDNRQSSSFVHFEREKPDGVKRVCALGDSFTHGHEVGPAFDYPSRLQSRLDGVAPGAFEVLNFGQSWFGFHQTYIVWDVLARGYGCDVVLLGPSTFFPSRDTTFNHTEGASPYYLHARYVLSGDGVRRIDVVGDSVEERFEEYQRLLPPYRYLRYDTNAPALLRAVVPAGWRAGNPFYYRSGSPGAEAFETYRILLRGLAGETPRLVVAGPKPVREVTPRAPGVVAFRPLTPRTFPYRAPRNHFGPMGNDVIARQYAHRVTGLAPADVPLLQLTGDEPTEHSSDALAPTPPADLKSIEIEIAGESVGHFVRGPQISRAGSPALLAEDGVAALALLATPRRRGPRAADSPLDGCFVPLARPRVGGTPVEMECAEGRHRIGRLRLWTPRLALGEVRLDDPDAAHLELTAVDETATLRGPGRGNDAGGTCRLFVGGEIVATGNRTTLRTVSSCYLVRANEEGFVDVDRLPDTGPVDLVARRTDGTTERTTVARWKKIRRAVRPSKAPKAEPARGP